MKTSPPAESPGQKARELLKMLQERFPAFRDCQPLAIGTDKELLARIPDLDRKLLRIALGMHAHSLRYLKAVEKATHRVDLDGNPTTELSAEHKKHAADILRERFKKEAERRKAERAADAARRAAEAAEALRVQKLSQLVEKFGKKK